MKISKTKITQSMAAKTAAFILLVLTAWLLLGCVALAWGLIEEEVYTRTELSVVHENFSHIASSDAKEVQMSIINGEGNPFEYEEKNSRFEAFVNGEKVMSNCDNPESYAKDCIFSYTWSFDNVQSGVSDTVTVLIYVNKDLPVQDDYAFMAKVIGTAYSLRYAVFAVGILSCIVIAVCFVFLLCSAGHRSGSEEISHGLLTKVPFDLLTAALIFFAGVSISIGDGGFDSYGFVAAFAVCFTSAVVLGTFYCMNFAIRVKLGRWWENTVAYKLLRFVKNTFMTGFRVTGTVIRNLPVVWKIIVLYVFYDAVWILNFLVFDYDTGFGIIFWLGFNFFVYAVVLYCAVMFHKLLVGIRELAKGNLSYKLPTDKMLFDFKAAAESLNSIADGMGNAVEERMKSERFKTELITNVSHDIKTPLTSIINYTELISNEKTDNERIIEYTAELMKQSQRMKKLINDLVEASKASTGNITAQIEDCEVGVLLTQTAGEYEQKLNEKGLTLITKQPEEPVIIDADGKLLWRVFDNLMNNICKYSQHGTRVYLSLENRSGKAVITFRNTSAYELNIEADELMERFVRGDISRSTEGSGLGLSIAKSLTELQNGSFILTVDGDLFKIEIEFPAKQ